MSLDVGRRINICGTSGSGKSTLGRAIADRLGLPYVELDAFHHGPNWTDVPTDEFRARVAEVVPLDGWVIDGNYAKARDMIWGRVETVVWLDYPLPVILWRLSRRTFGRCFRGEELWHGNREILWRHLFTRDSLFWWVLTTYRERRTEFSALFADPAYAHVRRVHLRSPREAEAILASIQPSVRD